MNSGDKKYDFEADELTGIYAGMVESVSDPEKLGRLKVRVPHAYGPTGNIGTINTAQLPWAFPAGLPAGGSGASGGIDWTPEVGDQVYVMFLDGVPEKPVWFWGNQTRKQCAAFPLHSYDEFLHPNRSALTRYGQTIEFNSSSIIATTSNGYAVILDNGVAVGQGNISLMTPAGQSLMLDDSASMTSLITPELFFNISNTATVLAKDFDLEALSGDINMSASDSINVNFGLELILGDGSEPFVLGDQLVGLLNSLLLWLNAHTHPAPGGTTSPPTPWVPTPAIEATVSEVIFGK